MHKSKTSKNKTTPKKYVVLHHNHSLHGFCFFVGTKEEVIDHLKETINIAEPEYNMTSDKFDVYEIGDKIDVDLVKVPTWPC